MVKKWVIERGWVASVGDEYFVSLKQLACEGSCFIASAAHSAAHYAVILEQTIGAYAQ
jgi:hypothetical protein